MKQYYLINTIRDLEADLNRLKEALMAADAPARQMYNDSLDDLPNWQILAWEELTEERRNEWRDKVDD